MLGIGINVITVMCGGILGTLIGKKMNPLFADCMNKVFGICAMGMGINSIILAKNMPPVILAVVLGTIIGLVFKLGTKLRHCGSLLRRPLTRVPLFNCAEFGEESLGMLETAIVLFCFSGTGIYGCLDAGMTSNCSILFSKSILDLFTAMVIACSLGIVVTMIAIPQALIFIVLFLLARVILPLTTQDMIADFKACGGILLMATGFRIAKIVDFPVADMLPAMVLVFPFSALWTSVVIPLVSR